jgi:hypothetical protein
MDVRSYRRVFELERRIYRVDRLRLNPSGVPVRGVVYFVGLVALAMIGGRLPGGALAVSVLPWYARDLLAPAALAALLAVVRIDGRPFHLAAQALVGYRLRSWRHVGLRRRARDRSWRPSPLLMIPDGSDAVLRRYRYVGPGALRVAASHELHVGAGVLVRAHVRAHLRLREAWHETPDSPTDGRKPGKVIVLERGTRVSVR